jgi:hypothetical protein
MAAKHGTLVADWGDGTQTFRLGLPEIEELEAKANRGAFAILRRLRDGEATLAEYRETIRLGLIGAGMDPAGALRMVRRYLDERPLPESAGMALAILLAGMARVEGDPANDVNTKDRAKDGGGAGEPGAGELVSISPASGPAPPPSASTGGT